MALIIRPLDVPFAPFAIVATFAHFLPKCIHWPEKRGLSAAPIAIIDFANFSSFCSESVNRHLSTTIATTGRSLSWRMRRILVPGR